MSGRPVARVNTITAGRPPGIVFNRRLNSSGSTADPRFFMVTAPTSSARNRWLSSLAALAEQTVQCLLDDRLAVQGLSYEDQGGRNQERELLLKLF